MKTLAFPFLVFSLLLSMGAGAYAAEPADRRHLAREDRHHPGTVDELLGLDMAPFAIGHRGFGANLGEDPGRPIENTVRAVRKGFLAGVSVVEVDVQLTKDGKVAVFHDDFLPDSTCLNRLTLSELQERLPFVPSLQAVLEQARHLNQSTEPLRGLVILELKAAAPLCDPDDVLEVAIVSAVTRVVRHMKMTQQVMLASFSPALLHLAAAEASDITRILSISGLQFLTAPEVEAALGLPVTFIDKKIALGLQWAEIGAIYRLPGYASVAEVFSTAAVTGVRVVEADLFFLGPAGSPFVEALHGFGLKAFGFTATNLAEWSFLESLGLDGIYTDDIPLGVEHQAPIP
jgi:glycerophosphoryl diester phosphodiesterase